MPARGARLRAAQKRRPISAKVSPMPAPAATRPSRPPTPLPGGACRGCGAPSCVVTPARPLPQPLNQPCPRQGLHPQTEVHNSTYQSSCSSSRPARTRAGPASSPPAARLRGRLRGARRARRPGCSAQGAARGPQRCLQAPPCAVCEACEPLLQSCGTASLLARAQVLARPSAERCLSVTAGSACARNAHTLGGLSTAVLCMVVVSTTVRKSVLAAQCCAVLTKFTSPGQVLSRLFERRACEGLRGGGCAFEIQVSHSLTLRNKTP